MPELKGALSEDLAKGLAALEGAEAATALRRALRELPLDGATALAFAERLQALDGASAS